MQKHWDLHKFSKHLFWDVDVNTLSVEKNQKFIVKRVLEYGQLPDWQLLITYLSIAEITAICKTIRGLDSKVVSFISTLSKLPRTEFLCYSSQQSTGQHWNF